jgi:hypothetical protein
MAIHDFAFLDGGWERKMISSSMGSLQSRALQTYSCSHSAKGGISITKCGGNGLVLQLFSTTMHLMNVLLSSFLQATLACLMFFGLKRRPQINIPSNLGLPIEHHNLCKERIFSNG